VLQLEVRDVPHSSRRRRRDVRSGAGSTAVARMTPAKAGGNAGSRISRLRRSSGLPYCRPPPQAVGMGSLRFLRRHSEVLARRMAAAALASILRGSSLRAERLRMTAVVFQ